MDNVTMTIDGRRVTAPQGKTVLEACQAAGIHVPTLCHDPDLAPYGACRLCIVEIEGMRGFPTSCTTPVREGMVLRTQTDELRETRKTIVEALIATHPQDCLVCEKSETCELLALSRQLGVDKAHVDRLRPREVEPRPIDDSHPAFVFDPNKCVLCAKCVRTCHELSGIGAIDLAFRGEACRVSAFGAKPLSSSICQSCGECLARCPTGALVAKRDRVADREVTTLCPYCGVGCSIVVGVDGDKVVSVRGDQESPVNQGELCVKGRFGLDFVNHPDRLRKPLIRTRRRGDDDDALEPSELFREAEWDEALSLVAESLGETIERHGPDSIGVLSSAKTTNEDNYIVQKFARAVLGTNNVDHCARLCHASTVAAALAAFGDGAMSNSIDDVDHADLVMIIGSNTTECHPVLGRKIKRAVQQGRLNLLVADPRAVELSHLSSVHMNLLPGTDVALLSGMMHHILKNDLHDREFIESRCEGAEPFLESLEHFTLETVERITGVSRERLAEAATLFGKAERAMILYGMGVTQHTTGTDNVKSVANLLMLTGNLGRRGTGFSPLRGQNNVQGACDMGALPNVYPGYQRVNDPDAQQKFENAWGRPLSPQPGLTLTDMFDACHDGRLKAMYVVGENPMLSEADLVHAKQGLAQLDFMAVQDIFLTETAQLADVVFPAASFAEKEGTFTNTERRIQKLHSAIEPPGEARRDWQIVTDVAARLGTTWSYEEANQIMDEIASLTPIYGGIHHDRLDRGGLQWPCWDDEHSGTTMLHVGRFTRGRGKFHVVKDIPPAELPTGGYPLLLTTGRILEHWHTGSMSQRSAVLHALAPESRVELCPQDAASLCVDTGDAICLSSPRGTIRTTVETSKRVQPGMAFMAFHWNDAPANILTNPVVDPVAKIPEYKVASVKAVLAVLEQAATDNLFLASLLANPAGVLTAFDLSPEHRAALISGDVSQIEQWIGPMEPRLRVWLKDRLSQETW